MRFSINTLRHLSALLCLCAGASCAHSSPAAHSTSAFRAFECPANEDAESAAFGASLKLALEVDYLEVFSHGGGHVQTTLVERGTACSGARDGAACNAQLTQLKQAWVEAHPDCEGCGAAIVVLTTRNDEVAEWVSPSELLTLLGSIDTEADAWLLLMIRNGFGPYACDDASLSGYRVLPEGIELIWREWTLTCRPVERLEVVERFNRDGSVEPVRRTVVEYERDGCYVP